MRRGIKCSICFGYANGLCFGEDMKVAVIYKLRCFDFKYFIFILSLVC